jgi:dUTP pyrophosphatase
MVVKIKSISKHKLPEYKTEFSAGMDLTANIESPVSIKPMERILIGTGIFVELPAGYEAQIRPRSGLAINKGLTVLNSPGTIDADYRGEIKVILVNLSDEVCTVNDGERICQMVISKHERITWERTENLNDTLRGSGGFGHTGV